MSNDEKGYNGWTNYETWRINLELLDDYFDAYPETVEEYGEEDDAIGLADVLEEHVDEILTGFGEKPENDLCLSYARSFVSEVNFHEIAEHLISDYKSNKEYEAKQEAEANAKKV